MKVTLELECPLNQIGKWVQFNLTTPAEAITYSDHLMASADEPIGAKRVRWIDGMGTP